MNYCPQGMTVSNCMPQTIALMPKQSCGTSLDFVFLSSQSMLYGSLCQVLSTRPHLISFLYKKKRGCPRFDRNLKQPLIFQSAG